MEGKAKALSLSIIVGIITLMIPYLIASFTIWDINPKNWSEGVRWLVCCFGILMCISGIAITYTNLKKNDNDR